MSKSIQPLKKLPYQFLIIALSLLTILLVILGYQNHRLSQHLLSIDNRLDKIVADTKVNKQEIANTYHYIHQETSDIQAKINH